jgi:hypothetical protein
LKALDINENAYREYSLSYGTGNINYASLLFKMENYEKVEASEAIFKAK